MDDNLLEEISKALPVVTVMFSSLGVWLMESSPMNYRDPSAVSALNTRTVPFGKGIPRPFAWLFTNSILFLALMFC